MFLGNRVYLRKLEENDLSKTLKWINDPKIFVTMGVWGPRTEKEQNDWFLSVSNSHTNIVFAICIIENNEHIGNISLFDIDYRNRNAGITIFIYEEKYRGIGYGEDALRILCNYAFNYLNIHKIYCKTDNQYAARLYEKVGFSHEGTLHEHAFHYGKYIDKFVYGLLSRDYLKK